MFRNSIVIFVNISSCREMTFWRCDSLNMWFGVPSSGLHMYCRTFFPCASVYQLAVYTVYCSLEPLHHEKNGRLGSSCKLEFFFFDEKFSPQRFSCSFKYIRFFFLLHFWMFHTIAKRQENGATENAQRYLGLCFWVDNAGLFTRCAFVRWCAAVHGRLLVQCCSNGKKKR